MAYKIIYGGDHIDVGDNHDGEAIMRRVEEIVDSGKAGFVEVGSESYRRSLLVTPGVAFDIREVYSAAAE